MSFRRQSPARARTTPPPPPALTNRTLRPSRPHKPDAAQNNSRNALVHNDMLGDQQPNESVLTLKFEVPSCSRDGQRSPVLRQRASSQQIQPYFHEDITGWETDIEHDPSRMTSGMRSSTRPSASHFHSSDPRSRTMYGPSRTGSNALGTSTYGGRSHQTSSGPGGMHSHGRSSVYTGSTPHTSNFESSRNAEEFDDEDGTGGFPYPTPDTYETEVASSVAGDKPPGNECALCDGEDGDVYVCKRRYAKKEEPKPMRFAECYENKFKELDSVRCEYEKQLWCLQKQLDKERRCTMEEFTSMQKEYCQYDKALEMYALRVAMDQIAISKANLEHEYADQIHTNCPDTDPQHPCCSPAICPPKQSNCCSPPPPCSPPPAQACLPPECCAPPPCPTSPCEEEPALTITYKQFTVACSVAAVIAFGLCVRFFCILKCLIFGCDTNR